MADSRFHFYFSLCFFLLPWSFLIPGTHQLQPSQTQVLLQLRKQLEYPKQLDTWVSDPASDLCFSYSPQANITCRDNLVAGISISGDGQLFKTLSRNFSMDSLVATLSRLNSLRALSLVSLGLVGPVPDTIHRLRYLEVLDFSWNALSGSVPRTLSRIVSLRLLKLDGNFLNATFPDFLGSFPNLTSLSLRNNMFTGPFPSSVQRLASLTDINLSNNRISGELPDLGGLSSLRWVDISNNRLDSRLPNVPRGVVAFLLSNNSVSGMIPEQYAKLNQLQQLDLSYNDLTGAVPGWIFSLASISSLNLASNSLSGSLQMHLSCGGKLQMVDISNNRLSGVLPVCLSSNAKNMVVKFGGNCLLVDQRHQHPETYCVESHRENERTSGKGVGLLIGVIGGIIVVLVVLAFGCLVLCRRYCARGTSEQHLLHKSVQEGSVLGSTAEILTNARLISDAAKLQGSPAHRQFSLDELTAATNDFDKSTLMGEGSNGKLYKGRLESGALVAIRCLTVSRRYTIRNLKLRLDLLAKLRHPHLVSLLGHSIESEGKNEYGDKVYLIYEYVRNGNYRAHLSETSSEKSLKWSDRLSVLVGIAKAVHFLHTGVIPGFYSNWLKTNNILLNEHRIGKLSDYGLSVVAQDINKDKEEDALKSRQMKSLEDDIYSFGFILLESLVGPSVLARKETFLQNEMVSFSNPDGQRRIVDPNVLASCSQESLSIVTSLTINCISPDSSARPSFEDVLWNLQYAAQVQATSDERSGKTLQSP